MICRLLSAVPFIILLNTAHSAPPPELTALQQQYAFAVAERVTAPYDAAVGELNTKYAAALDSAATQAKGSGDLPTLLAIQADKKLLTEKQPLPEIDDKTPEVLKKLRSIYRGQLTKITEQRTANATALLTPYAAKLKELEAKLTKADRIAEAQEILAYRESLKAGDAPAAAVVATPTSTTAPVVTSGKEKPTATAKVKGDDRKAAEWVISVGGKVKVDGSNDEIASLENLPKGRYSLQAIILDNNPGNIQSFTDADFVVCGGLEKLDWITLNKLEITTAALDTLCTCPNLTKITLQYNRLGDDLWQHLSGVKKLVTFQLISFNDLPVSGIGLSKLSQEALREFNLGFCPIADEALSEVAPIAKLTFLGLENTKVTDAGVKSLATLKKLTRLHLNNTEVTAAGLAALKSLPIAKLGYGSNLAATVSQAQEVAALFPNLDELMLPRECNPTADDWSTLVKAWPKLRRISVNSHILDDVSCAGLTSFTALEELELHYCPVTDAGVASLARLKKLFWLAITDAKLTDAALDTLAKMKSLKTLKLPKPGNGLTADGIAKFKKQRSDVQVN